MALPLSSTYAVQNLIAVIFDVILRDKNKAYKAT